MLFSTPLLRAVNLSIAVLLLALLGAVYWYVWRPLPETSGNITAPIHGPATIARDSLGVPHIKASSWEDAVFLQGFAMAQDRMWQMDATRRLAGGDLAEVAGACGGGRRSRRAALAHGSYRRRAGTKHDARRREPFSPRTRAASMLSWRHIADGCLRNLRCSTTSLDRGGYATLFSPRCRSIANLTSSWRDDLAKYHLAQTADPQRVSYLYPLRTGGEVQPGSNAWVVSGAHTASGKPILANDPHLNWTMPSTWYQVHLTAPDLDVVGMTLPGVPAVIIGHNQYIAWGVTNLGFDVQDLYREHINMQNGRYEAQGQVAQAAIERDVIIVKGAPPD